MSKTKICAKCKKELDINMFGKKKSAKDGLQSSCKYCVNESGREYCYKNSKKISESQKKYYKENKNKIDDRTKKYNKNNAEKIKKYHKDHREENIKKYTERETKYRNENPEKIKNISRKYRENNKDKIIESGRKYYEQNLEKAKECRRRYKRNNLEKIRIYTNNRRAKKLLLTHTLTTQQWEQIKNRFGNACCYCGKETPLTQDHFLALSKGGEYAFGNIVPSCQTCNSSKNKNNFFSWYPKYKYFSEKRKNKILKYLHYDKNNNQQLALTL